MGGNMKELKVEVSRVIERCGAGHKPGDCFYVKGQGMIKIPGDKSFCLYAVSSLMPFLTAKQREDEITKVDWISETTELCCPDPDGVVFKISDLS